MTDTPTSDHAILSPNSRKFGGSTDAPVQKAQEVHEYVKTKYDYTAENPEGLSFYAGQFIQVLTKTESGWWNGRLADKQGWFPYTYAYTESPTFVPVYAQSNQTTAVQRPPKPVSLESPSDSQTGYFAVGRAHPSTRGANNPISSYKSNNPYRRVSVIETVPPVTRPSALSRSISAQNLVSAHSTFTQTRPQPHSRRPSQVATQLATQRTAGVSTPGGVQTPNLAPFATDDWNSLSFEDLIVLQNLLSYPSPISRLRHPDSTPFEDALNKRFLAVLQATSPDGVELSGKTNSVLYLEIVHRALWILENAAVATALQWESTEGANLVTTFAIPESVQTALANSARDYLTPAIYCVIGSVRTALSSVDCLDRDSFTLQTYPALLVHRKDVLTGMARLVTQTKRLGHRGLEEPTSPVNDDGPRRALATSQSFGALSQSVSDMSVSSGSASGSSQGCATSLASVDIEDVDVRRELERSQVVYESMREFIIAVFECGLSLQLPRSGVVSLLGLAEDEDDYMENDSEGEGSWEEDPSFRFHVRSTSASADGGVTEGSASQRPGVSDMSASDKYAMRARRFAKTRPGHARGRASSVASIGSASGNGNGNGNGSISGGSRSSGGSLAGRQALPTAHEHVETVTSPRQAVPARAKPTQRSRAPSNALKISEGSGRTLEDMRDESAQALVAALRAAKSLGDLRHRYGLDNNSQSTTPVPRNSALLGRRPSTRENPVKANRRAKVIHGQSLGPMQESESSLSSNSSDDSHHSRSSDGSNESEASRIPLIPHGPCTIPRIVNSLRSIQDRLLHSSAAFIGAAQYHSTSSNPASKGYLVSLTREIVDFVRVLLIIADAVTCNASVRESCEAEVDMAREYKARLYAQMNRVVDSVRQIATVNSARSDAGSSQGHDDCEQEIIGVCKRAHLANSCARELVLSLKLCLSIRMSRSRTAGELRIDIPEEVSNISSHAHTGSQSTTASIKMPPAPSFDATTPINLSSPADNTPRPSNYVQSSSERPSLEHTQRLRAHTTREAGSQHILPRSLHKKAASMVGINAVYRHSPSNAQSQAARLQALQEERRIRFHKQQASTDSNSTRPYVRMREEPEEGDSDQAPLLMPDAEESDSREDGGAETEDSILPYSTAPRVTRRSIDQVRRSLERGLLNPPSVEMLEPSTPIDGPEQIVEIEEEPEEPSRQTGDKSLPATPSPSQRADPRSSVDVPNSAKSKMTGGLMFNDDGSLAGGTLPAFIEYLTPSDAFVDLSIVSSLLLTFRLFATPIELAEAAIYRFYHPLENTLSEKATSAEDESATADRIQFRVLNLLKEWVRSHWYAARDVEALPTLQSFLRSVLEGENKAVAALAQRIVTELSGRRDSVDASGFSMDISRDVVDRMRSAGRLPTKQLVTGSPVASTPVTPIAGSSAMELPRISKSLINQLKARQYANVNILDFNPLELARQLTLLENRLYCRLRPEVVVESTDAVKPADVRAMSDLNAVIVTWIANTILKEGLDVKRRVAYMKFWLKVAKESLVLKNFSLVHTIESALQIAPIRRLKSIRASLPQKYNAYLEEFTQFTSLSGNFAAYRSALKRSEAPGIPFMGRILSDVVLQKQVPAFRPSPKDPSVKLVNFSRCRSLAAIMADMIRFQQPYNLKEVAEIQHYLNYTLDRSRLIVSDDELDRLSQLIESKQPDDNPKGNDLFNWNFGSLRGPPVYAS